MVAFLSKLPTFMLECSDDCSNCLRPLIPSTTLNKCTKLACDHFLHEHCVDRFKASNRECLVCRKKSIIKLEKNTKETCPPAWIIGTLASLTFAFVCVVLSSMKLLASTTRLRN